MWRAARLAAILACGLAVARAEGADLGFRYARDFTDGDQRNVAPGTGGARYEIRLAEGGRFASVSLPVGLFDAQDGAPMLTAPERGLLRDRYGGPASLLGDARITMGQQLVETETGFALDLALRTRLPAGAGPGLQGRPVEQVLRLDASLPLAEGVSLDVSIGRRFAPAARTSLRGADHWVVAGTLSVELGAAWTAGLLVDAQDRQSDSPNSLFELGAFLEREMTPDLTLGLVAWQGMTRESAAFAIGLRLAYRIGSVAARLGP